jgi:hypothetical protein
MIVWPSSSGAADDRVVDEDDALAHELALDRVQLLLDRFLPQLLPGHDERARDVPVLDKSFAVGQVQGHRAPGVKRSSQPQG